MRNYLSRREKKSPTKLMKKKKKAQRIYSSTHEPKMNWNPSMEREAGSPFQLVTNY